jgi:hypothetical protein
MRDRGLELGAALRRTLGRSGCAGERCPGGLDRGVAPWSGLDRGPLRRQASGEGLRRARSGSAAGRETRRSFTPANDRARAERNRIEPPPVGGFVVAMSSSHHRSSSLIPLHLHAAPVVSQPGQAAMASAACRRSTTLTRSSRSRVSAAPEHIEPCLPIGRCGAL